MTIYDKNPAIKYYSQDIFSYGYAIGTFSDSNNANLYSYVGTTEHEAGILAHHFEPKKPLFFKHKDKGLENWIKKNAPTKIILDHIDNWNNDTGRLRHRFGCNSDIWDTNQFGYMLRDEFTHRCLNSSRSATGPQKD